MGILLTKKWENVKMPKKNRQIDDSIYQLKITLQGSKPPIWRRIQVANNTTLEELHMIIQVVMGWSNYHLHQFVIGDVYYGVPESDYDFDMKNEVRVKLSSVVNRENDSFIYEYDFGDSWVHQIVVEKILSPEAEVHYPVCVTGKRACPPEDCGGIWGYDDFLEAIQDPNHPEHEDMLEWIGGEFDPEAFDLDVINDELDVYR